MAKKFQLWSRDEYGQGAIINSSDDKKELIKEAKQTVSGLNVDNALTIEDKKRNVEAFFVEIVPQKGNESIDAVYNGKDPHGDDTYFDYNNEVQKVPKDGISGQEIKIYLGKLDREDWYAEDARGRKVSSLTDDYLNGKTVYFVRKM